MLGFALGGFFDGIMLHQVLQWHHLLSGLEGTGRNIRFLIMTDGFFHLFMYLVAIAGLWLLWSSRSEYLHQGADRRLVSTTLVGFGIWHCIDAVVSHWILGLHHIKMDSAHPLFWDISWFVIFGLLPIAFGLAMRQVTPGARRPKVTARVPIVVMLALSGLIAAVPPPGQAPIVVVFRPGTTSSEAMEALAEVDGSLVWADTAGTLLAIRLPEGMDPGQLYRHGALFVSSSILPAGCLDWMRT